MSDRQGAGRTNPKSSRVSWFASARSLTGLTDRTAPGELSFGVTVAGQCRNQTGLHLRAVPEPYRTSKASQSFREQDDQLLDLVEGEQRQAEAVVGEEDEHRRQCS